MLVVCKILNKIISGILIQMEYSHRLLHHLLMWYTKNRGASFYSPGDLTMVDFFLLMCSKPRVWGGGAHQCLLLLSVAPQMVFKNLSNSSCPTLFPSQPWVQCDSGKQWGELMGCLELSGLLMGCLAAGWTAACNPPMKGCRRSRV